MIGHTRHMELYEMVSIVLTLKSSHMYHIKTLHHHHHCGLNQDVVLLCPSGHLPGCFLSSTFIVNTYYKRNARRSSTYNAIIAITTFVFDTSNNAYQFTIQNHKKKEKTFLEWTVFLQVYQSFLEWKWFWTIIHQKWATDITQKPKQFDMPYIGNCSTDFIAVASDTAEWCWANV